MIKLEYYADGTPCKALMTRSAWRAYVKANGQGWARYKPSDARIYYVPGTDRGVHVEFCCRHARPLPLWCEACHGER